MGTQNGPQTYAQILNGTVINILLLSQGDYQDPQYVWVNITNLIPQPGIGWLYSNGIFTNPAPPITYSAAQQQSALYDAAIMYQEQYIDNTGLCFLATGIGKGLPNSLADQTWIQAIWNQYLTLYSQIVDGSQEFIDCDFSNNGPIPFTLSQIMQELGLLNLSIGTQKL